MRLNAGMQRNDTPDDQPMITAFYYAIGFAIERGKETAFTVIARISSPARATITATPVANKPIVSRNRRASSGACEAFMMQRTLRLGSA